MKLISFVFSFRNEEKNLKELVERVTKSLQKINNKTQPFVYCGLLEFSEHFENTSKPVHIIFESIEYQDNPNSNLKEIYESIGFKVVIVPGKKDLPDLVFMANQLITTKENVIFSKMNYEQRVPEVEYLKEHFSFDNFIQADMTFESMGDCLEDYDGKRFFCGYGFRTKKEVYDQIQSYLSGEKIYLELINHNYYHLDTCLSIVNKEIAFYVKSAFSEDGIKALNNCFSKLVAVDEDEAMRFLACNAHCPDGKNIIVEKNALRMQESAKSLGLVVHTADTSEFLKSGGSIFCLKNQCWW